MAIIEEREARIRFGTTGIEQLRTADSALVGLESRTGSVARQAATLGNAHAVSGEKLARYATTAGLVTGQMQGLGVQNEVVARSIGLVTEGFTGMLGPIGLATTAIGLAGAGVAYLVNQKRLLKEELAKTGDALVDYAAQYGVTSETVGMALRDRLVALEAERGVLVNQKSALEGVLAERDALRGLGKDIGALPTGMNLFVGLLTAPTGKTIVDDLQVQAQGAEARLIEVNKQLSAVRTGLSGGTVGPTVGPQQPGAGTTPTVPTIRPLSTEESVQQFLFQIQQERLNEGAAAMPPAPPPIEDVRTRYAPQLLLTPELEQFTAMREQQLERESMATERMAERGRLAYSVLASTSIGLQTSVSRVTSALLDREERSRLRGATVAKFVAGQMAAAAIQGLSQYAATRVGIEIAELASYIAKPLYWGLIPAQALAVAKWSLIGGVTAGIATSMSAGAQKDFNRDIRKEEKLPTDGGGGTGALAPGGSPSARMAQASSAPQTNNYYLINNYHGSVVYGSGGERDWFYSTIVPLIQEARGSGVLN